MTRRWIARPFSGAVVQGSKPQHQPTTLIPGCLTQGEGLWQVSGPTGHHNHGTLTPESSPATYFDAFLVPTKPFFMFPRLHPRLADFSYLTFTPCCCCTYYSASVFHTYSQIAWYRETFQLLCAQIASLLHLRSLFSPSRSTIKVMLLSKEVQNPAADHFTNLLLLLKMMHFQLTSWCC